MKKIYILVIFFTIFRTLSVGAPPLSHPEITKKIALTFDACMTGGMLKRVEAGTEKPLFNEAIVAYLHQERIPATIFITGLWAKQYPEAVKEIATDPLFEIGNHSYSHRGFVENCFSLPSLPDNEKGADLLQSQEILTRLTGKRPKLFRFPGGCFHPADLTLVKNLGLRVVDWTFASGDAFNNNTEAIIQNVLFKAKAGAIIVFHLSGGRYAPKTAEVLKTIIPELRKRGYEFVTVSALLNYN